LLAQQVPAWGSHSTADADYRERQVETIRSFLSQHLAEEAGISCVIVHQKNGSAPSFITVARAAT
jgi:hypothetical protein